MSLRKEELIKVLDEMPYAIGFPSKYYHDQNIFQLEMDHLFSKSWLCVARSEDFEKPGDFLVREFGSESIIIIRGEDNKLRAFHNFCRHRGSKLFTDKKGSTKIIQCPYHAWTYTLSGKLVGAPNMERSKVFEKEKYSLVPIKLEEWGGFVFINLDPSSPPLQEWLSGFINLWSRFDFSRLRRGGRLVYDVATNWKMLCENYQECYHCPPVHPLLNKITPYNTAKKISHLSFKEGKHYSASYMEFAGDYTSMTKTGYTKRPLIKGMTSEDKRRIYDSLVIPNMFFSLHPDYLMIHTVWPISVDRSLIECDFYFEPEAIADPSFDPSDAMEAWDEINKQDWNVCELSFKGTTSRFYVPGPYADNESGVHGFDKYMAQFYESFLDSLNGKARE